MNRRRGLSLSLLASVTAMIIAVTPAAAAELAVVKRKGDTSKQWIALTFDDGYNAKRSKKVADILEQHGVTGTFMPYANAVKDAPAAWKSIAARFPIANHTVSHANLSKRTAAQVYAEINDARKIIEEITGQPMLRIFRPPYMAYSETVLRQSYRAGFKTLALWTVDAGDAIGKPSADSVYRAAIAGKNGGIVLLHAGPSVTVQALPRIISHYKRKGFKFVTLGEMLGVPWKGASGATASEQVETAAPGPPPRGRGVAFPRGSNRM
jgi:peptidoglycan-N-acetylglucosamine deacetylase